MRTAFGGPGARDAFELVTRAATEGRYEIDAALTRPELGRARQRFVFALGYAGRTVWLTLNEGFVSLEFVELAGLTDRTAGASGCETVRTSDARAHTATAVPSASIATTAACLPGARRPRTRSTRPTRLLKK